jgi:cytochrome c
MGRSYRAWASFALAILACLYWSGAARAQTPTAADFQKVTLDDNTQNPMELACRSGARPRSRP